jgi:hypothetical protein
MTTHASSGDTSTMTRHTHRRSRFGTSLLALVGGATLVASCQSLEVSNPNTPDVGAVFGSGQNLEAALLGSWRAFWGVAQGARTNSTYPVKQLSILANEMTSADVGDALSAVTAEPRFAIDNRNQGGWTNRKPWYDLYESMASAREAYQAMADQGLKVGVVNAATPEGADTQRSRVFAKFMVGVNNIYLGLLFNQAYLTDEKTNPATIVYELKPYQQVTENGIRILREAIAEARAARDFTLPANLINGQTFTRDELIRVMHSYIIRARVYNARTPQERAAVNWGQVLAQLDSGIVMRNFAQQADLTIAASASTYYQYSYLQTNGRTHTRLLGPADTSGEYQRWLARPLGERAQITIVTPDRRIHAASGPTVAGTRFAFLPTQSMSTANGTYMHSRYRSVRFLVPPLNNYHQTGLITTMSVDEMRYIRAEALIRLNRPAEALALINPTRTAAGLPAVTVAGPPNDRACVPKRDDGSCGDLFDALQYEKRIDLFPTEAIIAFADARGWGKLISGTPLHFPVHGRELELLGFPYYTIGGGGAGSAP